MKESGMDKLIELLNEYGNDYCGHNYKRYFEPNRIVWEGCDNSECSDLLIISEKFGFIKWLIENDKIDFEKLENLNKFNDILYLITVHYGLLMILSIQDNPIEFLVSIL